MIANQWKEAFLQSVQHFENAGLVRPRLYEDAGQDQGLWSIAQSLSALYLAGSEERRWVEGVLP